VAKLERDLSQTSSDLEKALKDKAVAEDAAKDLRTLQSSVETKENEDSNESSAEAHELR